MPKMDYFGSKSPKLPSAGGSATRPSFSPAAMGFASRSPFRFND